MVLRKVDFIKVKSGRRNPIVYNQVVYTLNVLSAETMHFLGVRMVLLCIPHWLAYVCLTVCELSFILSSELLRNTTTVFILHSHKQVILSFGRLTRYGVT